MHFYIPSIFFNKFTLSICGFIKIDIMVKV